MENSCKYKTIRTIIVQAYCVVGTHHTAFTRSVCAFALRGMCIFEHSVASCDSWIIIYTYYCDSIVCFECAWHSCVWVESCFESRLRLLLFCSLLLIVGIIVGDGGGGISVAVATHLLCYILYVFFVFFLTKATATLHGALNNFSTFFVQWKND